VELTGGNCGGGRSETNGRLFGKNLFADEFERAAEFAAAPGFAVPVGEAVDDPGFAEVGVEEFGPVDLRAVVDVKTPAFGPGTFNADLVNDARFKAPDFVAGFVGNNFPAIGGGHLDGGG
jgi:hypothetical protein